MRPGLKLFFCALLVLVTAQGCSSSQTSGDGMPSDMGALESGADEVGSIPEDMLAKEELPMGGEFSDQTSDPASEPSDPALAMTDPAAPAADPFADLSDAESKDAEEVEGTNGEVATYTVKPGDTLMKIAFSIYGDIERWKDLQELNKDSVKNANSLRVGMSLKYEAPLNAFQPEQHDHAYVIKQGDTLAGIADDLYGRRMKYRKLQNYNKNLIKNPHRIFAGFTIFYDITAQEMAEAEARRKEKMAGGVGTTPMPQAEEETVPSTLTPPAPAGQPGVDPLAVGPPAPASTAN